MQKDFKELDASIFFSISIEAGGKWPNRIYFWSFHVLQSSESLSIERTLTEPALDLPENH